jgi:chromate transporter
VAGIFDGIKPAVVAIVLHAAYRIGTRALRNAWLWGLAAASFVAIFALDTPFPVIVVAAALVGGLGARRWPKVFVLGGGHGGATTGYGPALIDDATPTPAHARFSRQRLAGVLLTGLALWAFAMLALIGLRLVVALAQWAGFSRKPRSSRSAAPTRCCRTCIRGPWSSTNG